MAIPCDQITQNLSYLLASFDNCHKINISDLHTLVEVIAAIYNCSGEGTPYNTLISDLYEPDTDQIVTYPANTYHSISIMILEGNITRVIDGDIVTFPTGTVLKHHFTTLNTLSYVFTVTAGSKVVVEYLIETI